MNIFTQFFKSNRKTEEEIIQEIEQDLMRRELDATRGMFGALKAGTKRDFFCLDEHTWIWYEEWVDEQGRRRQMTTRYMIRPNEVVKSQNGGAYKRLSDKELLSFQAAIQTYASTITQRLYAQYA